MQSIRPSIISKELSITDTGENGCHQAGILVPKDVTILPFFPHLDGSIKNPRCLITFSDQFGKKWGFNFIYYNGAKFDRGKNEYRLTGMTKFFREYNVRAGGLIVFERDVDGFFFIRYDPKKITSSSVGPLKLSDSWKVVKI